MLLPEPGRQKIFIKCRTFTTIVLVLKKNLLRSLLIITANLQTSNFQKKNKCKIYQKKELGLKETSKVLNPQS
jgi:hypothetical protein